MIEGDLKMNGTLFGFRIAGEGIIINSTQRVHEQKYIILLDIPSFIMIKN